MSFFRGIGLPEGYLTSIPDFQSIKVKKSKKPNRKGLNMTNPPNHSEGEELEKLLKLIYGKDVIDSAYASPAGRITKSEARHALKAREERIYRNAYSAGYQAGERKTFPKGLNKERRKEIEAKQQAWLKSYVDRNHP